MHIALILDAGASRSAPTSGLDVISVVQAALTSSGHTVRAQTPQVGKFETAVRRALEQRVDAIVTLGDARTSAQALNLLADTSTALGVLSLDGLHAIARELALPQALERAALALGNGEVLSVDVGEVNGRVFAVRSVLGLSPWLLEHGRTLRALVGQKRGARAVGTLVRAVADMPIVFAEIECNGVFRLVRTPQVVIGTDGIAKRATAVRTGDRVEVGKLSLHVGPSPTLLGALQLARDALRGGIHEPSAFTLAPIEARSLTIHCRRNHMLVALDDHVELMRSPLRYHIRPRALSLLCPRSSEDASVSRAEPDYPPLRDRTS